MFKVLFILGCAILADAQVLLTSRVTYDDLAQPSPYQFSYTAPAIGGSSSHQETGDAEGRKSGSYTVTDEDGRQRIVEYVADENGFRAAISTNEPGTSSQNPADVTIDSSADDGYGQALAAPAVAVAPVAPVAPIARVVPTRIAPRPTPLPLRRPAVLPFQPFVVPIQPTYIPFQPAPAVVPFQPAYPRRFISQPAVLPYESTRILPQPAVIPIDDGRIISNPEYIQYRDNVYSPFGLLGGGILA